MLDAILNEFHAEAETTRNVLAAIPEGKFDWKPHAKSMSIGALGQHIASTPTAICKIFSVDTFNWEDMEPDSKTQCTTTKELLQLFDKNIEDADKTIRSWDASKANGMWKLNKNGKIIMELPRVAGLRGFLLNHTYHHRGQLTVYLRLLDVPVPPVYGPTADINPFE